jgi:hypothetical protein
MRLHLGLHHRDLLVQHADHRDRSTDRGGVSGGDNRRLGQLLAAQGSLNLPGLLRDAAAAGPELAIENKRRGKYSRNQISSLCDCFEAHPKLLGA